MREKPKTWEQLEDRAGIARNQPPTYTRNDITRLERQKLGSSWGKLRRKFTGPK